MKEIVSRLTTGVMGRNCICYTETDSTNVRAKVLAEEGKPHGTLVCAEMQTQGKGRRGKAWSSPAGEAVYMSLLLRPSVNPSNASGLTLVMGLAAAEACNEMLRRAEAQKANERKAIRVQLKWPNDLVLEGRKIAGILTEMSTEADHIHYVIIGIGINVNTEAFPEELRDTAGSLYLAAGQKLDRAELAALCMQYFEHYYERFTETEDLSLLREKYSALLVNTGRTVRILEPEGAYTGTARGINNRGELLVETAEGNIKEVYAGEVSVRGVYGYV